MDDSLESLQDTASQLIYKTLDVSLLDLVIKLLIAEGVEI